MTVSNSKPESYVPHSPFTPPGVSSSKALLLTLPGSAAQLGVSLRPLAACGIAHLRVKTSRHFLGGWVCSVQGARQPLASLSRGCSVAECRI